LDGDPIDLEHAMEVTKAYKVYCQLENFKTITEFYRKFRDYSANRKSLQSIKDNTRGHLWRCLCRVGWERLDPYYDETSAVYLDLSPGKVREAFQRLECKSVEDMQP
jgi:hypothetical protein